METGYLLFITFYPSLDVSIINKDVGCG